jgi:hypothetical protein
MVPSPGVNKNPFEMADFKLKLEFHFSWEVGV